MRQSRLSGSVEGVMGNHDSYSDFKVLLAARLAGILTERAAVLPTIRQRLAGWKLSKHSGGYGGPST